MTGLLVVRELSNDGKQVVYLLDADSWTLADFQMWMLGLSSEGYTLRHGSECNEILAYYPYVDEDEDTLMSIGPLNNSNHKQWDDPEGLPRRYEEDWR